MPALPLDDAGGYVAAAYIVFVVLLLVYVGIMAAKLGRISREITELADHAEQVSERDSHADEAGAAREGAVAGAAVGAAAAGAEAERREADREGGS